MVAKIFKKYNKFLNADGTPKTVVVARDTGTTTSIGTGTQNRTTAMLRQYWNYYRQDGTVFASINITAMNTIMVGYSLISENDDAKNLIKKKLASLSLEDILLDNTIYALVFGDAFIEKIPYKNKNGDIARLKTVNPVTMIINSNKYGEIDSYQQVIGGKTLDVILKPDDIIHIRFFPRPESPYGLSIIEPSKITIDRKMSIDDSLTTAIIRHGTGKYVVTVGDKNEIPPKPVFDKIKAELENITAKNEFIVPGVVSIDTIDEKGVQGVKDYFDYFQTQLVVGLMCPEEALGMARGVTNATAKVKEIMYERFIKSLQHKLSNLVRLEIINPVLKANGFEEDSVFIIFHSVTDADEAVKAKWLGNLLRGYPERQKPFTINEIRSMFDFPPIEGGDVNIIQSKGKRDSDTESRVDDIEEDLEELSDLNAGNET